MNEPNHESENKPLQQVEQAAAQGAQAIEQAVGEAAHAVQHAVESLPPHAWWLRHRLSAFAIYVISRLNDQLPKFLFTPFIRITPRLFVGPQLSVRGWEKLRREHGVTSIVNLRVESDDRARGIDPEHYLWLPTIDHTSPTIEQLREAANFIKARVDAGEGVYIHCAAGVGRAPLTAAAYLIAQGYSVDAALDLIRGRRPFINQSSSQRSRLAQFAEAHQALNSPPPPSTAGETSPHD